MTAYKFLGQERVGPFSGFRWPEREWIEAERNVCVTGIHACAVEDLPYWLNAELWEIELEDPARETRKLVARRGRLVRRIEDWNRETRQTFAESCVGRLRGIAKDSPAAAEYVSDAERRAGMGDASMTAFIAARAAEVADGQAGYDTERLAQANWLGERLGLAPLPEPA